MQTSIVTRPWSMVLTFEEKKAWQNMCIMYIIYSFKICFTLLVFQLAQNWNQSSRRSKLCSEYFNTYYSKYIKRKTMQQKRKRVQAKVISPCYLLNLHHQSRQSLQVFMFVLLFLQSFTNNKPPTTCYFSQIFFVSYFDI